MKLTDYWIGTCRYEIPYELANEWSSPLFTSREMALGWVKGQDKGDDGYDDDVYAAAYICRQVICESLDEAELLKDAEDYDGTPVPSVEELMEEFSRWTRDRCQEYRAKHLRRLNAFSDVTALLGPGWNEVIRVD